MPFFFQRTEVAQSTKFVMATSTENHVTVLWAKGTLQNSAHDFTVPIDSTLVTLIFALSSDIHGTTLEVAGPDGAAVDRNAEVTDFTCGRYIVLKKPAPGAYRVHVSGSGHFWLTVGGKSGIFLSGVEFVELGGRPGHEGMFPIHGEPLFGKQAHLEASISGDAKQVAFGLMTPEGGTGNTISLKIISTDQYSQEFEGGLDLPREPFRVVASGVDASGYRFQRVHDALARPTSIAINLTKMPKLGAGQTSEFTFQVTNLGDAGAFRLSAICAKQWTSQLDRTEIVLARGESARVVVNVSVPAGTDAYASNNLIFSATSKADALVSNAFVQHLSLDPDDR